jgi:hypothetical protein
MASNGFSSDSVAPPDSSLPESTRSRLLTEHLRLCPAQAMTWLAQSLRSTRHRPGFRGETHLSPHERASQRPSGALPSSDTSEATTPASLFRSILKRKPPTVKVENGAASVSGTLLETSVMLSNFSAAPANLSVFEVPAGYKLVESQLGRK